jgi:nitrogen-specific signal transduction histidine kinase
MGMNPEMNPSDAKRSPATAHLDPIVLDSAQVGAMRHGLHELANVLTGLMIAGGLLSQYMEGKALRQYASGICEGCERGGALVRDLRSQLLAACGEAEAGRTGTSEAGQTGQARDKGSY